MQISAFRVPALFLALCTLLALPGAAGGSAFPGTNGLIAFERGGDIYTVSTGSSPSVSSSPLVTGAIDPAWSADGKRLAFSQAGEIRILTIGGSTTSALDTGTSPAFSPDGTMIAYEKGGDIWVISSSGGTPRNLSNSGVAASDDEPVWSPDGDFIAFTRTAVNADIYVMDAPTSPSTAGGANQMQLTTAVSNETHPTYLPGGTRIAYASDRHGVANRQIYSISTSGGTETRVTSSAFDETQPAYAPDGTKIAFARTGSGIHTTETQLTSGAADANPDWQPAPPTNSSLPVITGTAAQGSTLFASRGSFAQATSYAYQWLRCDSDGGNCSDISGATASSYTLTSADVGKRIRVRVTASSASGSSSATSEPTAVVAGPEPKNTVPPKVIVFGSTGIPVVGVALSSSVGTWTGSGFLTYTYQWKKCMPKDGPCYRILTPQAQSSTFVPTKDLIGWYLRVEVTATNASASATEQSESTPAVVGNPPVNTVRPRVSIWSTGPQVGQELTVDSGTWTGLTPLTYTYEWRRCDPPGTLPSCKPIPGATGTSYTTTEADLGWTLRVYVTASNPGGEAVAFSDHTFPTVPKPRLAPSATAQPAVTGKTTVGSVLTGTRGTWSGFAPIRLVSVWQRCDATLTVCRAVKTVKGLLYRITAADIGYRIRLSVVAVNPVGSLRVRSGATEPIVLAPPKPAGRRRVGTERADYLPGGGGDDQLFGLGGSDTLPGGGGNDRIDGGDGNDYIDPGKGVDRVSAGAGSDTVVAIDGEVDRISCGAGNDRVVADPSDVVDADCELVTRRSPAGDTEPGTP